MTPKQRACTPGWGGISRLHGSSPVFYLVRFIMDTVVINDVEMQVVNDGGIVHVMLRTSTDAYDITEMVYNDGSVKSAIESLEAMEE